MKSKNLSRENRQDILNKVKAAFEKQWADSPLQAEMDEIQAECQALLHAEQLRIVPKEHRDVLDLYDGGYDRMLVCLAKDKNGNMLIPVGYWRSGETPRLELKIYSPHRYGYPKGYPGNEYSVFNFLKNAKPVLLSRFLELAERRACETKEIVDAHETVLNSCRTTRQVYDNDLLRPYLPQYLLDWEPEVTGAPSAEALAKAKAFADSLTKE